MKKLLLIILLCISLLMIVGCSEETHASETSVVDAFFTAYTAQDFETASTFIAESSQDVFLSTQGLINDSTINNILLKHMTNLSYKMLSTEEDENQQVVKIRVVYKNAGGAFMNAIGSLYVDAAEGQLSNDSKEAIGNHVRQLLLQHLDKELEVMDREKTLELIRENDEWRIVMTEEFKNVLSANMMNAIEELKIMGVEF